MRQYTDIDGFLSNLPPDYFTAEHPIHVAHAPGRLDVMGGISDYSGGLCLEWPLHCTTHCAVQLSGENTIKVRSANAPVSGWQSQINVPVEAIKPGRVEFPRDEKEQWTRYILGAMAVLAQEYPYFQPSGARIYVASNVPPGAGVSSSAALEVAALYATVAAFQLKSPAHQPLGGLQIARLAQRVENDIVGVPCGIMDQLTCALGRENQLMRVRCQPDIIEGYLKLPEGVQLFGIDSGVKHSVGGGAYGHARCAAFMGRRILQDKLPQALRGPGNELYLANLTPDIWRAVRESIPESITGREFLKQYGDHGDSETTVEPEREYSVRLAAEHPIYEADRTARFATLLQTAQTNPRAREPLLNAAGDLMIQSHFSYGHRCKLGSPETDVLVRLARNCGPKHGVLGAKITGGGQGGTVAIMTDNHRNPNIAATIAEIAAAYERETGALSQILSGSSEGAEHIGQMTVTL